MTCRLCSCGVPRKNDGAHGLIHATQVNQEVNTPSRLPGQSISVLPVGWTWFPFEYCEENPDAGNYGGSGEAD